MGWARYTFLCELSCSWSITSQKPEQGSPTGRKKRRCEEAKILRVRVTLGAEYHNYELCFWVCRLLCPWNSPGKNTGVGCHSLLWGIFPTQGSNMGLLHCRRFLYWLSQQVLQKVKHRTTIWSRFINLYAHQQHRSLHSRCTASLLSHLLFNTSQTIPILKKKKCTPPLDKGLTCLLQQWRNSRWLSLRTICNR